MKIIYGVSKEDYDLNMMQFDNIIAEWTKKSADFLDELLENDEESEMVTFLKETRFEVWKLYTRKNHKLGEGSIKYWHKHYTDDSIIGTFDYDN